MEAKTCAASLPIKGLLETKGVSVGWKQGNKVQNYVSFYERILAEVLKKGSTQQQHKTIFHMDTEKMSFVVFNGIGYKAGDLVVLKIDYMQGNVFSLFGDWTWKAKITSIFMQEFMGYHELFFQAKYFQQLPMLAIGDRALNSDLSFMHILKPNPIHFQGDDVQLISMLLLKFMVHPMVGRVDAINASELADIVVQSHLGEPGSCPPWPQVNDLIFYKPPDWGPSRDFPLGVV
jgi:hypothetical protein